MISKKDLHILMLEDDPLDADLNRNQLLLLEEYHCIVRWVTDQASFLEALETNPPDIIISDYSLPQYNGSEALNDLKQKGLFIPFIFVTGTINEETAADTIKAGAWEYVVKDRLFRLPLAIRGALKLKEEKINTLKAEELNRKLSMAMEQSPVHIIIMNIKGKIEYVNARFTEITGYLPEEVVGQDYRILASGAHNKESTASFWDDLRDGKSWRGEFQSLKKDKTLYWESTSISPLKNEQGEITHFIAVKEDISQRKTMEQDLIRALDRAERSDKLKDAFLQNLSHEIRTPMNAIVGFASLLNDPNITASQQDEFKSIILNSSNQLLSIVSDVLTISRIQTGQENITLQPTVIGTVVENLQMIFKQRLLTKKISLIIDRGITDLKFTILTDETKLSQILANLLSNAIKFTNEGFIRLGYKLKGDNIVFYMEDTGIGIAQEAQELIFERFRQADTSISTNYGGTGLGLSISKSFAEMLGGSITLVSELGKGSTFELSIPCNNCPPQTMPLPHSKSQLTTSIPLTILIAEDEEYNFQLLEAYLSDEGYTLLHAKNGKEAIALCRKHPDIALIFMDIKMPEMDGRIALTEIRKFRDNLPIIAQTAYALEHEKKNLLENGFNDYIAKPIKKDEVLEKTRAILAIHKKQ